MGRMFGTNGVRGVVNQDMNIKLAMQMGKAVGVVFPGTAAIATDTRVSADMLRTAVSAGLMSVGCDVVFLGAIPTPALQYYVKMNDSIACGIMITASHNPPEFNGIKVVAPDGTEASKEQESAIEDKYDEIIPEVPWNMVGGYRFVPGADDAYVDAVISKLDVEAIRAANLTVVLDCANGAAFHTSPLLLKKLGVRAITINGNPQGEFPGHPSEPTADNLADLCKMVVDTHADLGIAHDGDADRCVFVDSNGTYVPGDKTLAILAKGIVMANGGGEVVTPVATSSVVDDTVKSVKGTVVRTAVGSPIVARKMMDDGGVFGGEENGGLIFPDHQYCRDGAMAIGRMLECIIRNGPLNFQLAALPIYYTEKRKMECPNDLKDAVMKFLESHATIKNKDKTDGLKLVSRDFWVLARPSGTEPIFRIYVESKDKEKAIKNADKYQKMVESFLSSA